MPLGEVTKRGAKSNRVSSGAKIRGGTFDYERAPELRSTKERSETYRKMLWGDPHIAESIRALTLPLIARASWDVKPAEENAKGRLAVDLVSANLYNRTSKKFGREYFQFTPWSQRLREILSFLSYGFSVFYKEWQRVDSQTVFRRLIWLEPETVQRWNFEKGELVSISRQYSDESGEMRMEDLEVKDLALYGWDVVGARLEGLPLVRSMFGAWSRKEFLLRCKMIAAQRASVGIPWAKWDNSMVSPPDDFDDKIEQMLANSLGSGIESLYFSAPVPSLEMGYLQQPAGEIQKFDLLADAENLAIAHAGGTKSQMLGETQSGSRALSEPMMTFQYVLAEAIGSIVAEQEVWGVANVQGVVDDLILTNFPEGSNLMPTICVENVDPDEKVRTIPLLITAIQSGAVARRPWLERDILTRLGFEVPEDALDDEQDYSRLLDPNVIRDKILDFEVVTKNELRAALGLPPLEGPEGDEWVKASEEPPPTPGLDPNNPVASLAPQQDTPGSGSADDDADIDPTATDGSSQPNDDEEIVETPDQVDSSDDEPVKKTKRGMKAALTPTKPARELTEVEKRALDLPAIMSAFDTSTKDLTSVYIAGNRAMAQTLVQIAQVGGFDAVASSGTPNLPTELRQRIVERATSELVKMGTESMKLAAAEIVRQQKPKSDPNAPLEETVEVEGA